MIDLNGYTREAIQKAMLDRVPRTLDTREGSVIQTALGPAAWYLEGLYMLLGQVQQNAYANTAAGQSLDYICAERGIRRKEAVAARRKGTFNVQIREGALFKTINGADSVLFMCTGKLLEKTDGSYTYEMVCQTAGLAGNSYSGSILPVSAISGLTSAVIGETILSGSDEEDDGSLRARYFETFDVQAFGGNIISYRTAILAVSGVGAVQVYPAWKGGGTVLCSILNSQMKPADSGLLKKVQELICPAEEGEELPSSNGYGMAPIGASVTITTANTLVLNISCSIQFVEGVATGAEIYRERVREKIQDYLDSVCATWGNHIKGQKIEYIVSVYVSRIAVAVLGIPEIVNVTDILINGSGKDLVLTETADLQQIPELGTVMINGG